MKIFYHLYNAGTLATFLIASMLLLFLPAPRPAAAVAGTGGFGAAKQIQSATESSATVGALAAARTIATTQSALALTACSTAAAIPGINLSGILKGGFPVSDVTVAAETLGTCIETALIAGDTLVMEAANSISAVQNTRSAVNTETVAQKQTIINILARIAISALIRSFTNQLIGWIQNDGGSNVGFVSDLTGQLRREADLEAGNFLNNLAGVNLCGDIGAQLRISLTTPGQLAQKLGCTLSQIGVNAESFFQDFSQGGWPAFLKIGLEPQNNPYGAYLIALDAKVAAEASARDGLLQRFLAGQGFQGTLDKQKKCRPVVPQYPGDPIGEECHYETAIKLPGSTIAQLTPNVILSDLNYLYAAREIDDAIIAVANALISKVISSAVSFSRGSEGETDAGPGIFDPELATGSLDVQELAGNSVEEKLENAILSSNTALITITSSVSASQRKLFLTLRQSTPPSTIKLEAELNTDLRQRADLLTVQTELMELKRAFLNAVAPQDIINAGSQFTALESRFNQIVGQIPGVPPTTPAINNPKTDTETELRNMTLHIGDTTSLLREMQGEVKRLALQEASTTPQRKIELDAKSKEIDAEVVRLGESRTAIAGDLSALGRAAASAEITAAVDDAITKMISSQRELQRANTLMVSIVPLLKPE